MIYLLVSLLALLLEVALHVFCVRFKILKYGLRDLLKLSLVNTVLYALLLRKAWQWFPWDGRVFFNMPLIFTSISAYALSLTVYLLVINTSEYESPSIHILKLLDSH